MRPGKWAPPGTGFDCSGTNAFVLSWIVERVLDMPFHDAVTSEIWNHIGAEGAAAFFAERKGIASSIGGFLAKARDMTRFGLLFTPSYKVVSDTCLMPSDCIDTMLHGGRPELMEHARYGEGKPGGVRHNVYQWDMVYDNDDVFKGGWAGQGLLINARKDLVAIYLGYAKGTNLANSKCYQGFVKSCRLCIHKPVASTNGSTVLLHVLKRITNLNIINSETFFNFSCYGREQ